MSEVSALAVEVPVAPRAASPWVVSAGFDVPFFLLSALAPVLAWIAVKNGASSYAVLSTVAVVSNGPHLFATWTRVYLDGVTWRTRPIAFIGVPLAIAALVAFIQLRAAEPARIINSAILYYASWHFAAQCYGLLRLYQRRSLEPVRFGHRVESAFVFLMAFAGLTWRLHFGPRELFGQDAYVPPFLHRFLVFAVAGAAAGSFAWVLAEQALRWWSGESVAPTRLAFLGTVLVGFGVPFFVIRDGTAAFAAAACWHGFQYLGIVWHFNRRRWGGGEVPSGAAARLVAWSSGEDRGWAFAALTLALAGLLYGSISVAAFVSGVPAFKLATVVWSTLTFGHYWLDGLIWKMKTGTVAKTLQAA